MSSEQTTLLFHFATPGLSRRLSRTFAKRLEAEVTLGRPFTCLITGDLELRRLNREFRKQDLATDVLSFPSKQTLGFLGDIAISPVVARRNAERFGRSLSIELRILILHGVLHLLGYDHETDSGEMERYEILLRSRFKLA